MRLFRWFFFFLAFGLQVKVKAERIEEPKQCWKSDSICSISIKNNFEVVQVGESQITLASESVLIRKSSKELAFVKGVFWVKAEAPLSIKTPFAQIELVQSEVWVLLLPGGKDSAKDSPKDIVRVVDGKALVKQNIGVNEEFYEIPKFFEQSFGPIMMSGRAKNSMLEAMDFRGHLEVWSRMYRGEKEQFRDELEKIHQGYLEALQESSDFYKRVLANVNEERLADEKARLQVLNQKRRNQSELRRILIEHSLMR